MACHFLLITRYSLAWPCPLSDYVEMGLVNIITWHCRGMCIIFSTLCFFLTELYGNGRKSILGVV